MQKGATRTRPTVKANQPIEKVHYRIKSGHNRHTHGYLVSKPGDNALYLTWSCCSNKCVEPGVMLELTDNQVEQLIKAGLAVLEES